MLNDFLTGALKCERASRIIPNIRSLLDFARKKKITIIYVSDAHLPGVDDELELWPSHVIVGRKGADIIKEVKPVQGNYMLQKEEICAHASEIINVQDLIKLTETQNPQEVKKNALVPLCK